MCEREVKNNSKISANVKKDNITWNTDYVKAEFSREGWVGVGLDGKIRSSVQK